MLVLGTENGVYRVSDVHADDPTHVLDAGRVMRVRTFPGIDGVFAASKTGLYRSTDGGGTWTDLDVPREEVYSILVDHNPDNRRLYAGTHPAHLYVSEDLGDTWRELMGFQDAPSREEWYTPRHRNEAHIRSLGAHPDVPNRVIASVEVGGVHISEDRGETWTERRNGLNDDVHHVLIRGPDEYIASCGDGLYHTRDAGKSWARLDDELSHRYFRETIEYEDRLYTAAARSSPGTWRGESGADGAVFISEDAGETFRSETYPGHPHDVVLAWTVTEETVVAGTNDGRILIETDDGWELVGETSVAIRSLCAI